MGKENPDIMLREVAAAIPGDALGKPLLVAVSGGADSVCLLHLLTRCSSKVQAPLIVAHCNFHLRGEESDRDMQFVLSLCRGLGVECLVRHFDVPQYCRRHRLSVEEGCRNLRYDWFGSVARERGCARIAVAHNADDNIETLLLNLLRGSGITGLCGMEPDNGEIWRPLLQFSRSQILGYLQDAGQDYVTDSTNLHSDYRRNYLRNEVLPLMERKWPGARKALTNTLRNLRDQRGVYEHGISSLMQGATDRFLPIGVLRGKHCRTLLHTFLSGKCVVPASMLNEITEVARRDNPAGRRWHCGDTTLLMRSEGLYLAPGENNPLPAPEVTAIPNSAETMERVRTCRDLNQAWFPGTMPRCRFRAPLPGDLIQPIGMKGSQKVSKIIRDAHLTPDRQAQVQVMEEESTGRILWIPGLKRSRHYLVTPETSTLLHYTLCPKP